MTQRDDPGAVRRLVVSSLGTWAAAWDELVAQAAVPSPFLRSWWLGAVAGEKSEFVLLLEDDSLIGGLAVERRRQVFGVPIYRFVGSGTLCPDHLDLLAAPGKEATVRRAIAEWFTQGGPRVLDLDGLVENSLLEATFDKATTTAIDVAPWDKLPADGADYLAGLSPNLRKAVRQAQRRLIAGSITHRRIAGGDTAAAVVALAEFSRLHQHRDGRGALLREMPRLVPALTAGLAAGEVQIDVLESPDRVVLVFISFRVGTAVRAYQSARLLDHDLRDAASVVLAEVARQACADGCDELDLLRGDEPYKARFVQRTRALQRLRASHGVLGAIVLAGLEAFTHARNVAGRARRRLRNQRGVGRSGRNLRRAAE